MSNDEIIPAERMLFQNYPNPFNPETMIEFEVKALDHINISIFDLNGNLVLDLVDSTLEPGGYSIVWDGKNKNGKSMPSGIYMYQYVSSTNITSKPGVIPTVVWFEEGSEITKIGESALKMKNKINSNLFFNSNFKRLIGNPFEKNNHKILSPTESGAKFFEVLWKNVPEEYDIKRLVLTAPIDTYKGFLRALFSDVV